VGMALTWVRARLRSHGRSERKREPWTHFSVLEVFDNVRGEQIEELEGLKGAENSDSAHDLHLASHARCDALSRGERGEEKPHVGSRIRIGEPFTVNYVLKPDTAGVTIGTGFGRESVGRQSESPARSRRAPRCSSPPGGSRPVYAFARRRLR